MAIHTCEGMHHRFVVGPGEPVVCPHCELVTLRAQLAAWTDASQCGHPNPCTLGSLCPYCEIGRLRAQLAGCCCGECSMSELREGLAKHLYGVIPFGDCTRNDAEALADSVLAYLHAHDGHAEFVRAVDFILEHNASGEMSDSSAIELLREARDAELSGEQSNG